MGEKIIVEIYTTFPVMKERKLKYGDKKTTRGKQSKVSFI